MSDFEPAAPIDDPYAAEAALPTNPNARHTAHPVRDTVGH